MPVAESKRQNVIGLLCVATIIPAQVAIAIRASAEERVKSNSFDGAYKGSWECEQTRPGEVFSTPLSIIVRNGMVMASTPTFDPDGRPVPEAMATGIVDPGGAFRIGYTLYTRYYSVHGDYSGTFNAAGGALTGTQVLTREITGDGATRTCKGTFLQAELPRK